MCASTYMIVTQPFTSKIFKKSMCILKKEQKLHMYFMGGGSLKNVVVQTSNDHPNFAENRWSSPS